MGLLSSFMRDRQSAVSGVGKGGQIPLDAALDELGGTLSWRF